MTINGNLRTAFSKRSLQKIAESFPDNKITITPYPDYEVVECDGRYICTVMTIEILQNEWRAVDLIIQLLND